MKLTSTTTVAIRSIGVLAVVGISDKDLVNKAFATVKSWAIDKGLSIDLESLKASHGKNAKLKGSGKGEIAISRCPESEFVNFVSVCDSFQKEFGDHESYILPIPVSVLNWLIALRGTMTAKSPKSEKSEPQNA